MDLKQMIRTKACGDYRIVWTGLPHNRKLRGYIKQDEYGNWMYSTTGRIWSRVGKPRTRLAAAKKLIKSSSLIMN